MNRADGQNNEGDLVDNSGYDAQYERCNSCQWFDRENGDCDHCAYGHQYVDNNGLKPNEVKNCEVYVEDESLKYEWQWGVYSEVADKWELTSYHSKPNNMNWVKFGASKRKRIEK